MFYLFGYYMTIGQILTFIIYIIIFIKVITIMATIGHLIFSHHSQLLDANFVFFGKKK